MLETGSVTITGIGGGGGGGATDVSVVGTGFISNGFGGGGFGGGDSFDVVAIADAAGAVSGTIRMNLSTGQFGTGQVVCLSVVGDQIVVGGESTPFGGGGFPPPPPTWFTLYLTDNGADGTADTAAFEGPSGITQPDCDATGPMQRNLTSGQVTIIRGVSDSGTVSGEGTSPIGTFSPIGTRTFEFDAERAVDGTVTGNFSIQESQGFSLFGQVVCLDIRGSRAMVVGRGQNFGGGGGSPYTYATFFIDDNGPAGSGDLIAVNAYRNEQPFGCLAPRNTRAGRSSAATST